MQPSTLIHYSYALFCGVLQRVTNPHLVHSMVHHPPGGRCCFWLAAGSKRTGSSRHAMIVWGRWSPPVGESKEPTEFSWGYVAVHWEQMRLCLGWLQRLARENSAAQHQQSPSSCSCVFCLRLFRNNSFYSHGSTWPSLVKRQPTFLSQPYSCEMGQGIQKWVGGPGQNDGLEEREWENRLIRSPKLLEDVWEREGWKGWRLKGFERVRDECQNFYTGKDLGFLTLWVHGTPAASRPLSLILLTPQYAQHSSESEEGTMERLDIMLSFMGFLCTIPAG